MCGLTEVMRQKGNSELIDLLNHTRVCKENADHLSTLHNRQCDIDALYCHICRECAKA